MTRRYKTYLEGFDMALLATALENGERFKGTEVRIDISGSGKVVPMVERAEICRVDEKFIELNFDKLIALRIIKEK